MSMDDVQDPAAVAAEPATVPPAEPETEAAPEPEAPATPEVAA